MQKRKLTDNNINKECWTSVEYIAIDFLCKHSAAALTPSSTKYCHNHINTRTQNTRIQIFEKASGSAALALSHSCHPAMDNIFGSHMLVFRPSNMIFSGRCLPTCSTQLAHVSARIVSLMRLFCCVGRGAFTFFCNL